MWIAQAAIIFIVAYGLQTLVMQWHPALAEIGEHTSELQSR